MKRIFATCVATLALFAQIEAKVSQAEAEALGTTLTPLGGEKDGNAEGTIPDWNGGISEAPQGYQPRRHHPDPYGEDEILFTITTENVMEHENHLSTGQKALFTTYGDSFRMNVYPTRRSASYPSYVYEAVRENATSAELNETGNGVRGSKVSSPFPIPENGLQAIWNHLLRWRGIHFNRTIVQVVPTSGGAYNEIKIEEKVYIPYNEAGRTIEEVNNRLAYFMQTVTAPSYLAGNILLVHDPIDQNREPRLAWVYNPGQRRVRRAPNIAFDNPGTASDGQRTTDQFDMFNGSPERYDWKLIGKQEMYVPYNSYKLHGNSLQYSDIINPRHMNPEHLRYELHRVWVVEANVKSGISHLYPKRVFYIDEDSWQILVVDQYDARGNIWRVSEAHCINYYELPMIFDTAISHYDLQNGRYLVIGLNNEESTIEQFDVPFSRSDFTPDRLRKAGRR